MRHDLIARPLRVICAGALLGVLVSGCQTPANLQELEQRNSSLKSKLNTANSRIAQLESDKQGLEAQVQELNRVVNVLNTEKDSRVQESSQLRGAVRQFVQKQIDQLKEFLLAGNLLDYVGGELIARSQADNKPILLVDLANRIPKDGMVTGVGAYFDKPTTLTVKVFRPVGANLVAIWESQPLSITAPGLQKISFASSVGVKKGDIIGYYQSVPGVSYDLGTGDTRFMDKDIKPGTMLSRKELSGEDKRRAYSIGVFGLLNY